MGQLACAELVTLPIGGIVFVPAGCSVPGACADDEIIEPVTIDIADDGPVPLP